LARACEASRRATSATSTAAHLKAPKTAASAARTIVWVPNTALLHWRIVVRGGQGGGMSSRRCRPVSVVPCSAFKGFRFPPEIIVLAVRWYLRYGLSYRDVEELLTERGIEVDHVTVFRWVQCFTPLLADAARPCRRAVGDRWFVDETYVKVAGRWRYVYWAVDQRGQIVDAYVSPRRDTRTEVTFRVLCPCARVLRSSPPESLRDPVGVIGEEHLDERHVGLPGDELESLAVLGSAEVLGDDHVVSVWQVSAGQCQSEIASDELRLVELGPLSEARADRVDVNDQREWMLIGIPVSQG
jgi:DDE domain